LARSAIDAGIRKISAVPFSRKQAAEESASGKTIKPVLRMPH
jgi:hypothetical protein